MHPVHKLFGLVMIFAVIAHLGFNFRVLASALKKKAVAIYSGLLIVVLILLYSVAINNTVPEEIAIPMDKLAAKAESLE